MKLVVDTNIIFSAILNSNSNIANILFHSGSIHQFYSCKFLLHELNLHRGKIQKLTKLSAAEVVELIGLTTSKLTFLDERLIPDTVWAQANRLIGDVDKKDIPFVSLSLHLKAVLWSSDKVLCRKLASQMPKLIISTKELLDTIR
ncbi:MAG: hypothetical protein BroJett042_13730 [Bacteroidota bacterium]|nr:MAG: hypothetical protein BroJett042_13730 [Bacteroidota bacterium]